MSAKLVVLLTIFAVALFSTADSASTNLKSEEFVQQMRTIPRPGDPRPAECHPGLCPLIHNIKPDLHHGSLYISKKAREGETVEASLCGNLCSTDASCPNNQKCCPTNCGYLCQDPIFMQED